jgi:hypothetical protein
MRGSYAIETGALRIRQATETEARQVSSVTALTCADTLDRTATEMEPAGPIGKG